MPLTSVDDVVQSMTDFDLFGDPSKDMDTDQTTGSKISSPETVHVSSSGTMSSPSSSKAASHIDASPIMSSKEGTSSSDGSDHY